MMIVDGVEPEQVTAIMETTIEQMRAATNKVSVSLLPRVASPNIWHHRNGHGTHQRLETIG